MPGMTALFNAAGARITKAAFPSTAVPDPLMVTVTADTYALVSTDNGLTGVGATDATLEGGRLVLKYRAGTVISAAERDAHYPLATVPGALSPASGTTAGGTVVTITGTNLTGVYDVTFGGTSGTNLIIDSATQIRVTTPAKTAGALTVVIRDDSQDISKATAYTYV
jgi:hypothetical protein